MEHLIVFTIDGRQFAFDLVAVERVVRAVATTSLLYTPPEVLGIINVQGSIIPVINMRKVFNLSNRDINLEDQFIICCSSLGSLALWVDHVQGVIGYHAERFVSAKEILTHSSFLEFIDYAIKDREQLTLVFSIDKVAISLDSLNINQQTEPLL